MQISLLLVVALALLGHGALWVGIVNRLHATGFRRSTVKSLTLCSYLAGAVIPLAVIGYLEPWTTASFGIKDLRYLNWATGYVAFCGAYGAAHLPVWGYTRWRAARRPASARLMAEREVNLAEVLGRVPARGLRARAFARVPFNELWQLQLNEYEVALPRLPRSLDGLSICHISDLHYCGRIEPDYFREVAQLCNAWACDLVVLTGDICDAAKYIDWVPETLADLQAPLGKFSILGNHDLRTKDVPRLRRAIEQAGFVDVGGRAETVEAMPLVIAGNERPWIVAPEPVLADFPADHLRLLLSHSPDQLPWARRHGFDLMLAGHTHGGQVVFPFVGPVVCPSWNGMRYAEGFFHEPPTTLFVSRGTASLFPYRVNCRPEVVRLVLRSESV